MNIYELHGRLVEEKTKLGEGLLQTLQLLKNIKEGCVDIQDVTIDDTGWRVEKK